MKFRIKRLLLAAAATLSFLHTQAPAQNIWLSSAEIATLPASGPAWDRLKMEADEPAGMPNLADMEDPVNVKVLAKALVFARTKDERYRAEVITACLAAIGTEKGGSALALGRKLAAYVIAADLVTLPPEEDLRFRAWLRALLTTPLPGLNLRAIHERRPNNWGTHAGASRVAVAAYLGDSVEIARCAQVFKGWLGDRASYAGFNYGDLSWQADPTQPVGINPQGAVKDGHILDGVLADDQRRGGAFMWPPPKVNYVYGALQGALVQAVILSRLGYEVWDWQGQALRRAYEWLYFQAHFAATGDDVWQVHLVNYYYHTTFPAPLRSKPGKNMGWAEWTHGSVRQIIKAVPGVTITESDGSTQVVEGGASDTYTIVLKSVPSETVSVTVTPTAQLDVGAGAGNPIVLTFTPGTALLPQMVTVTAVDDAVAAGNHRAAIMHCVTSSDANYNSADSLCVLVNIADNEARVPEYVFLANDLIKINQSHRSEGDIHCNGRIEFGKGLVGGEHTGNLTAGDDIKIADKNTITGEVRSGDEVYLLGNATATGAVADHAQVAMIPLPNLAYSAGGSSATISPHDSLALAPGSYNTVNIAPNGKLIFSAGDYYINRLDTEPAAILVINVAGGPVHINVVDNLELDEEVSMHVIGGPTNCATLSTLQTFKLEIGKHATVRGNLIVPRTEVHFAAGCTFKGYLCARTISLEPGVQFSSHHSILPFLKAATVQAEENADENIAAISGYELAQNYPNPFFASGIRKTSSTMIRFSLPRASEVTVTIYNATGQLVRQLVNGNYASGNYHVAWDARDNQGARVASGVYLYVLKAGAFVAQKQLLLMK